MSARFAWLTEAACSGYVAAEREPWPWDTDQLRTRHAQAVMAKRTATAKLICAACPVRDHCLTEGLVQDVETDTPAGIWGGSSPEERAEILGKTIKWVSGMRRLADPELTQEKVA